MPDPRLLRVVLPALVAVALALGCSPGGTASPPTGDPASVVPATRTVVEFGPDAVVVAEILRIGDDARATVRTPTRLFGREVLLGEDHYVYVPETELVLGVDRWIHTDLSDPRQRRHHETNPAGFIDLADLVDLRLGDVFADQEILDVRRGEGVVFFDLGHGQTIEVTTETVTEPEPIVAPPPDRVVELLDLPSLVEVPSMLDGA